MKIAVVTPGILPVPSVKGGAVETLIDYILEYNECFLNHEIIVYGIDDNKLSDFNFSNFKKTRFHLFNQQSVIYRLKRKLYSYFNYNYYYNSFLDYFAVAIRKEISCLQFDVVVVENRPGFILPLSLCTNAKVVLHLHNDTLDKEAKDAKKILDKCAKIFTVSNYIKSKVDTIMPTDKVQIVYNGIDIEKFRNPSLLEINRSNFGLKDDDFVVVYAGRIEPIKGIKELIEAFLLLSDYEKIKLLIVGGGNGNNDESEFISEMHKLALSIPEKVIFTGFQSYGKIPSILSLCNMGVIPSICEDAFPLSCIENMTIGLPLVVTKSGGIPDAVDEECAIIVEKDSDLVSNLATAILELYIDEDRRLKMSTHAKERSKLFSKEKYALSFFSNL
ncbi:spore coat protein SA [Bacteroides luti]|uniref:Spore coat protein SA n=1 Tax=Bacteroides luti TaxID=1297750 RepID=A0A1M5BG34_9BACE|nr:glycosyltransferase family 4 protein [Bacteroides luti]SHF41408.1 spore coat protein SA [Bacteroides luti]